MSSCLEAYLLILGVVCTASPSSPVPLRLSLTRLDPLARHRTLRSLDLFHLDPCQSTSGFSVVHTSYKPARFAHVRSLLTPSFLLLQFLPPGSCRTHQSRSRLTSLSSFHYSSTFLTSPALPYTIVQSQNILCCPLLLNFMCINRSVLFCVYLVSRIVSWLGFSVSVLMVCSVRLCPPCFLLFLFSVMFLSFPLLLCFVSRPQPLFSTRPGQSVSCTGPAVSALCAASFLFASQRLLVSMTSAAPRQVFAYTCATVPLALT